MPKVGLAFKRKPGGLLLAHGKDVNLEEMHPDRLDPAFAPNDAEMEPFHQSDPPFSHLSQRLKRLERVASLQNQPRWPYYRLAKVLKAQASTPFLVFVWRYRYDQWIVLLLRSEPPSVVLVSLAFQT